jgi:hypothetical protein
MCISLGGRLDGKVESWCVERGGGGSMILGRKTMIPILVLFT